VNTYQNINIEKLEMEEKYTILENAHKQQQTLIHELQEKLRKIKRCLATQLEVNKKLEQEHERSANKTNKSSLQQQQQQQQNYDADGNKLVSPRQQFTERSTNNNNNINPFDDDFDAKMHLKYADDFIKHLLNRSPSKDYLDTAALSPRYWYQKSLMQYETNPLLSPRYHDNTKSNINNGNVLTSPRTMPYNNFNNNINNNSNNSHRPHSWMKKSIDGDARERAGGGGGLHRYSYNVGQPTVGRTPYQQNKW